MEVIGICGIIMGEMIRGVKNLDLKKLLNKEQYEAATTIEGPLLILAGAGSGKTRVLTHRIAYMINEKGIEPWELLAITFTNKAAGEMKERVRNLIGEVADNMWISTFHSSCARILRRDIEALGYRKDFTIYDTYDQKSLMKQVMKELNLDDKEYPEKMVLATISNSKNILEGPHEFKKKNEYHYRNGRIADCYELYQKKLKQNNALDFDDIIMKTVELFRKHPDVLDRYRRKFSYILVDEYQDTNHAQYMLIKLLAEQHQNLCVVGDDDQSIYEFRGADIRNILDFEKDFPTSKVIKLEQNYRSVGNILDAANHVIVHNLERKVKALRTIKEKGEKVRVYSAYNDKEEASFVAHEIKRLARDGRKCNEFAILYRTNAQSRNFEEAFMRDGIPYRIIGGLKFYDRKEVKDIIAYLRLVNNPFDEVSLRRVINVPKRAIGGATVEKLGIAATENDETIFDLLQNLEEMNLLKGKTLKSVLDFREMHLSFIDRQIDLSVSELIKHILEKSGYMKELVDSKDPEDLSRIENLEEFVNAAIDFETVHPEGELGDFLESVALVSDLDSMDSAEDAVLLMTLHSAKGLEFPVVFMVGMENGLFPGAMSLEDPKEMEESRRLAYVGITRAMDLLYMTHAEVRMVYGRTVMYPPSEFLQDIPKELKEKVGVRQDTYVRSSNPRATGFSETRSRLSEYATREAVESANSTLDRPDKKTLGKGDIFPGTKVKHPKFGIGTVIKKEEEGSDVKVVIAFDSQGIKNLILSLAPLELV
jgi:DNA helicase-2/ATP-dependent DNA helicase PcrA